MVARPCLFALFDKVVQRLFDHRLQLAPLGLRQGSDIRQSGGIDLGRELFADNTGHAYS